MAGDPLKKGRYTKFGNKIGLYDTKDGNFVSNTPEVVLNFPFKDAVLEAGMTKEDAGRDERFLNIEMDSKDIDALEDPKVLTNFKYIDKDGEKVLDENSDIEFFDENGDLKQNLLIKGNNLLALYTLREKLAGRVKLIYIDPPFNTGSDSFKYNDNFNHSSWLVFMKNRLEVAKDLLDKNGLIFVHCDYKEDAYLRVLMDEIFGQDYLVAQITVRSNSISGVKTQNKDKAILKNKDTILVYKMKENITIKPQYTEKTDWDTHYNSVLIENDNKYEIRRLKDVLIEEGILGRSENITERSIENDRFASFVSDNREVIFRKVNSIPDDLKELSLKTPNEVVYMLDGNKKRMYAHGGKRLSLLSSTYKVIDGKDVMSQLLGDLWTDIDFQNTQNQGGGVDLTNGKKPETLIKRIIDMATNEGDIVLDFFAGSATTPAVAHKMHRRWIGVEQMDYIETKSLVRMQNVINSEQGGISKDVDWQGGGSFVYVELKKYNQDFIDRIMAAASIPELEEIYEDMQKNAFLKFFFDKAEFEKDENFRNLDIYKRKEKLVDILDENQLYLNFDEMNDGKYHVTPAEKELTNRFYQTNEEDEADNGEE